MFYYSFDSESKLFLFFLLQDFGTKFKKIFVVHYLLDGVYFPVNKVLLTRNIENLVQWTDTLNQMCIKYS